MTVTMELKGDDAILKALAKLGNANNQQELYETLGSYGVSSTQERFLRQSGPDGQAWKPTGRGGQILRDSARLFLSIMPRVSGNKVEWGTNVIYAAIHQFGGTIDPKTPGGKLRFRGLNGFVSVGSVRMPARPYMGINEEDRTEIINYVHEWMRRPFEA